MTKGGARGWTCEAGACGGSFAAEGFEIVAVADDDRTGWSCWKENGCAAGAPAPNSTFTFIPCSGAPRSCAFPESALEAALAGIAP